MSPLSLVWAAAGTIGFSVLFDLRPRDLPLAAAGAVLGWGCYSLAVAAGSMSSAFFVAAAVIGIWAEIVAAVAKRPASIYIVCAILPIVPGSGMYQTMLESVRGNLDGSLQAGFTTLMAAGAIAAGLAVSSALSRILSLDTFARRLASRDRKPRPGGPASKAVAPRSGTDAPTSGRVASGLESAGGKVDEPEGKGEK